MDVKRRRVLEQPLLDSAKTMQRMGCEIFVVSIVRTQTAIYLHAMECQDNVRDFVSAMQKRAWSVLSEGGATIRGVNVGLAVTTFQVERVGFVQHTKNTE